MTSSPAAPDSLELERLVLGRVLVDREFFKESFHELKEDHFSFDLHKSAFLKASELLNAGLDPMPFTISEEIGGTKDTAEYLLKVAAEAPMTSDAAAMVKELKRVTDLRTLEGSAFEVADMVSKAKKDRSLTINDVEVFIDKRLSMKKDSENKIYSSKRVKNDFLRHIGDLANQNVCDPLSTGFPLLDQKIEGLTASDLMVVAATPGGGKTAFSLNVALSALRRGNRVLIVSIESPRVDIAKRMLVIDSKGVLSMGSMGNSHAVNKNSLAIVDSANKVLGLPYTILEDTEASIEAISLALKKEKRKGKGGFDLVVVDYIQTVVTPEEKRFGTREREIAHIMAQLRKINLDFSIPIIALSQLNRASKADVKPGLFNLAESAAVERYATKVVIIHPRTLEDDFVQVPETVTPVSFIVAKNRDGATGEIPMFFLKRELRFSETFQMT